MNFILLTALLTYVVAKPEGYYYEKSSSRSSSSSYKNNQLQHQTDDESFFAKQGDTEGRTVPKINTYNQHIEYQNPNREDYSHSTQNQNMHGYLGPSDRYSARQALGSDGIVRTISGNRNHHSYSASYGVSGGEVTHLQGGQYDTQSNLLSITERLQNDLSRQLQNAITAQQSPNSFGGNTYVESEFGNLERELKANLTRQLQEELAHQYGTQINRGSHSYSVKNGHYSSQANYNTQELQDLSAQVESNLMQQLRNQYQNTQSGNHYLSQHAEQGSRGYTDTYRSNEAFPLNPEVRPQVPLTSVLSQVQNTVDRKLNHALSQIEQQYSAEINTYNSGIPNYDLILDDLKAELKRNLTSALDTILLEYYGSQEEHNNYYYSTRNVASGLQVANYKIDDLNSIRQQVENNLVQKLQNSIQQQKQTYQTTRQTYEHRQQNTNQNTGYNTDSPKIYTSYVAFTPSNNPDSRYLQSNAHQTETFSNTYGEQHRPNPTPSGEERPTRYGVYQPSSQNTNYVSNNHRTSSDVYQPNSQRATQLEYDYSAMAGYNQPGKGPTQVSQSPYRGTHYSSGTGDSYSSGNANYPVGSSHTTGKIYYPSSNTATYPANSGSNYQTFQSNNESSYNIVSTQDESGVQYLGSSKPQIEYQSELINLRDEVRDDISRQLSSAIQKQKQSTTSYSSSTVSNNQVLDELSNELKRNLTQKIEQSLREHYGRNGVRGGYSFTVSSGGRINSGNYNREQLTALTTQLQDDLLRQLREGLAQEAYRQSTSHSSSSYEPVISHGAYGHGANSYNSYSSGSYSQQHSSSSGQGECCMQSDDSTATVEETIDQHTLEENGFSQKIEGFPTIQKTESMDIAEEKAADQSNKLEIRFPAKSEHTPSTLTVNTPKQQPSQITEHEITENNESPDETANLNYFHEQEDLNQNEQIFDQQSQFNEESQPISFNQQIMDHFDQIGDQRQGFEDQEFEENGIVQHSMDNDGLEPNTPEEEQNEYLLQQSEAMTQQIQNLSKNAEDFAPEIQSLSQHAQQTEDLSQGTRDLTQQTEDLSQQTGDLTQQTQDLSQQIEDLAQHIDGLTQPIEETSLPEGGYSHDAISENLSQENENLNQRIKQENFNELVNQDTLNIYSGHQSRVVVPHRYLQPNQQMLEHAADYNQHTEPLYQENRHHGLQNSQLRNTYFPSQLHYGAPNQVSSQMSRSLEEQYRQQEDISHIAQVIYQENPILEDQSTIQSQQLDIIEITTEKPGFWKKMGKKISSTYHKAKDSITSIG